ncbi:MAG: hypothetical protein ACW968_11405, partial [Candidatus Thorarchaeota archaeon]
LQLPSIHQCLLKIAYTHRNQVDQNLVVLQVPKGQALAESDVRIYLERVPTTALYRCRHA